MDRRRLVRIGFALACAVFLTAGCASMDHAFETKSAHPGLQSAAHTPLADLPAPQDKIVAAVYQFRDQTGQYKAKERGSSFSRAVTQGATSILIKALKDSDWFRPIERKGLSNLVKERDIIRSIRSQYQGKNAQQLSPLLYAGVILEGGIIGYDTNVITGGGGFRLAAIGGSGEYRQDQITVYLRAVSTQTGEVLKTVHTTKTILSQKLDGGAFRYIGTDLLMETEAGISYNEPTTMAVTEAIDASVRDLIVEGLKAGVWGGRLSVATRDSLIQRYEGRKKLAARRDHFDRLLQPDNRPGLGLEVSGGGLRYQGDFKNPQINPSGSLALRGMLAQHWALGGGFRVGRLKATERFEMVAVGTSLDLTYYFVPHARFTPFLRAEGGAQTLLSPSGSGEWRRLLEGGGRLGVEYMFNSRFGLSTSFGVRYAASDNLDGASVGTYHDSVWEGSVGFTYYLGTK